MQKRRYQKVTGFLILGVVALLASCSFIDPDKGDEYDFSIAVTQWELYDHPDELVEDSRFENLTPARAKIVSLLPAEGTMVGRYVGDDLSEHEIIGFLLENYVVDANQHIVATVYLMAEWRNEMGYSASLVSEDPYWTNQDNLDIYHFVISIQDNGEIWLHKDVLRE